jgi:hypothetical protein
MSHWTEELIDFCKKYFSPFCLLVEVHALIMNLELTTTLAMEKPVGQLDFLLSGDLKMSV